MNLQEFIAQLVDDDATNFRAACMGCAVGLIFAPEPVRFCSVSVPFLIAAVAPALYEVGN